MHIVKAGLNLYNITMCWGSPTEDKCICFRISMQTRVTNLQKVMHIWNKQAEEK